MKKEFKTRPFRSPQDWTCPIHKLHVSKKIRMKIDDNKGTLRYSGEYFGCPRYSECRYYVSPGDGTRPPMVADV